MPTSITITYSPEYYEFRVPGPAGTEAQAYYTDDKEDAEDTAKAVFGSDVVITWRDGQEDEV